MSHACCPTDRPALPGKLKKCTGVTVQVPVENAEPIDCYMTGTSKHWLVVVYDIFGMHPNKYELADWIAANRDLSVAIPDIRRGKNWPIDKYPLVTPEDKERFSEYLAGDANPLARGIETRACIDFLTVDRACQSVSLLGLCWGAKVCSLVGGYKGVKCVVGAHPSFLKSEDGENTAIPTLLLPTKEDNLTAYLTGALRNPNPSLFKVSEKYFATFHGFLGARGQWDHPDESPFVENAKVDITEFVAKHNGSANRQDSL